ncbi:MAG: META domain-containing protein [Candidatus Promineifilaceae bacterium]
MYWTHKLIPNISPILVMIALAALLLVACGGDETPTAQPTTVAEEVPTTEPTAVIEEATTAPTTVPTEEAPTAEPTTESFVADPALIDITWEWVQRTSNSGQELLITVPNLENYTLLFDAEGAFTTQLDCNNAAGSYTSSNPGSIFMELGPMTQAACSPDSLAGEMVNMFGPVQNYVFEENGQVLIFKWVAGGPWDFFRKAGSAPVEPDAGESESEIDDLEPAEITLDLQGLAQSYEWQTVDASPIPPGPGGQGFPRHLVMGFDRENPLEVPYTERRIMYIFPVSQYTGLYSGQGNESVAQQVARLEELIATAAGRQSDPEGWMPLLPPPSSLMDRWVQFLDLDFNSGRGVRYVSDSPFRQSIGVWTNDTMDYYYQGLTTDGLYYVSLKWPVSTESLPNTAAEASDELNAQVSDPDSYAVYVQETKELLNALPSSAWNPDLAWLDAMVQSLTLPESAPSPADEEEIELPPAVAGEATGTVIAPDGVFLRTGPGTEYPYIGAAPFEASGEIVGVSEDGQWWAFIAPNLPDAPDDRVWASATFIEANNAENVPVVPAPPLSASLTGVTWQWESFVDPLEQITIEDPSRYTVTFDEAVDGTGQAAIKADCNDVAATYTVDGSNISIVAGPSTLVACPEDSLDQQILANLSHAVIFFFEEGDLFLDLIADGGTMRFTAASN